jgi:hypothetical protein
MQVNGNGGRWVHACGANGLIPSAATAYASPPGVMCRENTNWTRGVGGNLLGLMDEYFHCHGTTRAKIGRPVRRFKVSPDGRHPDGDMQLCHSAVPSPVQAVQAVQT